MKMHISVTTIDKGDKQMDKIEFANEIAKKISEQNEDLIVKVYPEIIKNNGIKLVGLSIHKEGINVSPTIYIDSMFDAKLSVDEAISEIMKIYDKHSNMGNFDVSTITDLEKAKDNIIAKVINKDRNEHIMDSCPYAQFGDMIIIFAVQVLQDGHDMAIVKITNELMNNWKLDLSDLLSYAYQNTKKLYKMKITEIQDMLYELMQHSIPGLDKEMLNDISQDHIAMYVVTSTKRLNGSYYITDRESLIEVAQQIKSDEFYILPSSIHELIVIPINEKMNGEEELLAMVKEVNKTELAPDEILADNVYIFNAKSEELRTIDGTVIPFVS